MTDRPETVDCVECGRPVSVKPSGRIPIRHTSGCPAGPVPRETATAGPTETAAIRPAGPVPRGTAALDGAVQVSPYRWLLPSGEIVDGTGAVVDTA